MPQDKEEMLACIDRFHALSPEEKINFIVGRRVGIYSSLDDLCDSRKREVAEQVIHKLSRGNNGVDEQTIYTLTEDFI